MPKPMVLSIKLLQILCNYSIIISIYRFVEGNNHEKVTWTCHAHMAQRYRIIYARSYYDDGVCPHLVSRRSGRLYDGRCVRTVDLCRPHSLWYDESVDIKVREWAARVAPSREIYWHIVPLSITLESNEDCISGSFAYRACGVAFWYA